MNENKYNDEKFFNKYSHFPRSVEGLRNTIFLGENVTKYHKTITTYLKGLIQYGFRITEFCEPKPTDEMLRQIPTMKDELRRPMMLIISTKKE